MLVSNNLPFIKNEQPRLILANGVHPPPHPLHNYTCNGSVSNEIGTDHRTATDLS